MAIKTFTTGELLTAADTNTYLANSGLVYIKQVALSSTTSVTSAFSSEYRNYRIFVATSTRSGSADIQMRLNVGASPDATALYAYAGQRSGYNTTAPTSIGASTQTNWIIGRVDSGSELGMIVLDICNPQTSVRTTFTSQSVDFQFLQNMGGNAGMTTQFDGFTLYGPATWTGTVYVYGYRQS